MGAHAAAPASPGIETDVGADTDPVAGARARLVALGERVRPVVLARERVLELSGPLRDVLPDGLARGASVAIAGTGATTVALHLLADIARVGSWVVVVDLDELGLLAAVEAGVDPSRLALVRSAGAPRRAEAIAALAGAVDLVLLDARVPLRAVEQRRLSARLRERGTIAVVLAPGHLGAARVEWPVDLTLTTEGGAWSGIGHGHGSLRSRPVQVRVQGRGRAARPLETVLAHG